jgi:hypothetical protein
MKRSLLRTSIRDWFLPIAACCLLGQWSREGLAQTPPVAPIAETPRTPTAAPPIGVSPLPSRPPDVPVMPRSAVVPSELSAGRAMDARECICLAARQASLADTLEARREDLQEQGVDHFPGHHRRRERSRELLTMALTQEANEIRNRRIGAALELFFRLAQAEAAEGVLLSSQAETRRVLDSTAAQLRRGLPVQDAYDTLRRQEIDLRGKRQELSRTVDRLNRALTLATMGSSTPDAGLIKPVVDWVVPLDIPDPEAAIAVGLESRPQLLLLRAVVEASDADNMSLVDNILGTADPLLAIQLPSPGPLPLLSLVSKLRCEEPASVGRGRDRARQILAWRERDVIEEIRDAALGVAAAVDKVVIARERSEALSGELDRVVARARRGLKSTAAVSSARLAWLKARGEVVDEMIEWHIQSVKLAQAQGVLIRSCSACSPENRPGATDTPH